VHKKWKTIGVEHNQYVPVAGSDQRLSSGAAVAEASSHVLGNAVNESWPAQFTSAMVPMIVSSMLETISFSC